MNKDKEMSEEDFLKKHLGKIDSKDSEIPHINQPKVDNARITDLQFFNFDVRELPCGIFYPVGSVIMVRPAQVREIQSYSMVDNDNFYDVVEKMNDILQACVRIKYSDGTMGSFLDIKDQDRLFLIFLVRELTFQQGNSLSVNVKCTCGNEVALELKRENFSFHEIDEKLNKYFSASSRSYIFNTVNGKEFELMPPNIGLQKSFTDYILKENNEKRPPNMSFLKIIPFMLAGKNSISYEGIKAKLRDFEDPMIMDDISFQFLNSAVSKMTFGIKELKKKCLCGAEVHTEMQFPDRASGIFIIHDAFEAYIKE